MTDGLDIIRAAKVVIDRHGEEAALCPNGFPCRRA